MNLASLQSLSRRVCHDGSKTKTSSLDVRELRYHVHSSISRHVSTLILMTRLLLTSFTTWRAHQRSNTSDDLIVLLQSRNALPKNTVLLRQLPVNFQLAPTKVMDEIIKTSPEIVVCCGMAEQRSLLTLERYGRNQQHQLETGLNLPNLKLGTRWTNISHDAGSYVCNHLYYQLLKYLKGQDHPTQGLFVHVPLLTEQNRELVAHDFELILSRLQNFRNPVELAVA